MEKEAEKEQQMKVVKYKRGMAQRKESVYELLESGLEYPVIGVDEDGPIGIIGPRNGFSIWIRPDFAAKYMSELIQEKTADPIFQRIEMLNQPQWDMRMARRDGWGGAKLTENVMRNYQAYLKATIVKTKPLAQKKYKSIRQQIAVALDILPRLKPVGFQYR